MEAILKITGSVCITVYILGLLSNLVNTNYTHRVIKLTFALFLITNVFVPLQNIGFDFSDYKFKEEIKSADSAEKILDAAADSIERDIKNKLDTNNVTYSDISVHINNQEDGVYLEYISISGADTDNHDFIRHLLENEGNIIFED